MTETAQFYVVDAPAPASANVGGAGVSSAPAADAPRDFREMARKLSPRFLTGPAAERFVGLLGLMFDALAQGAQYAVISRQLFSPTFAADALRHIGNERMLPRYLRETLGQYHTRLHGAWRLWRRAGSEPQIREQLELAVQVPFEVRDWSKTFDDRPDNWSRRWLFAPFGSHPWEPEGTFGDGQVFGDGGTIGSTASVAEVELMRTLVELFRPGHIRWHLVLQVAAPPEFDGPPPEFLLEPHNDFHRRENRPSWFVFLTD